MKVLVGLTLILLVMGYVNCKEDITVPIPSGGYYRFLLENQKILDWTWLASMHSVSVEQLGSDQSRFKIYYSDSYQDLEKKITSSIDSDLVYMVDCLKDTSNVCTFSLSHYGTNSMWWIPRFEYFLNSPPSTNVVVVSDSSSLMGLGGKEYQFRIIVEDTNEWKFLLGSFIVSVSIFMLSSYLSTSMEFYMVMWFVLGALLSVGILFVFLIYTGLSISPKMTSIAGMFTIFLAVGGGTFYYNYLAEFFSHPAQHR